MIDLLAKLNLQDLTEGLEKGLLIENHASSAPHAYLISDTYYFKELVDPSFYIKEKLVEMICQNESVATVETFLASLGPIKGELTKTFRKPNKTYLTAAEVLATVYEEPHLHANIKDLLTALEKNYHLNKENIENLQKELVKRLMIDIITMQSDRTINGFDLVITNGNVALAPVFDSEKSFKNYAYQEIVLYNEQYNDPFKIKFSADEESSKLKTYPQITAFLNKCNDEEQAYFKDLYEKYSPLFIETFLKDVDDTIKTPIIRDYTTHYQNLGVILSKEKGLNHE